MRVFSSRRWLVVAIAGVLFLVGFAFVREYVRNSDIATELARMEAENASLNAQHLASLELISQLSTETAVENEARKKLNLAKEGETLYVVDDEVENDARHNIENTQAPVATDSGLSNPAKWFYYFFAPESLEEQSRL